MTTDPAESSTFTRRSFDGERDRLAMSALVHRFPERNLHVLDLPYRLSSWAFEEPDNIALWHQDGRLAGWAALQTPFWSLDYAYDPESGAQLQPRILEWADRRAWEALRGPFGRPCWYTSVFRWQLDRLQALTAAGYASQEEAGEDSWTKVWMVRPASTGELKAELPEGYRLRPLAGEDEVQAYVALHREAFGTNNMTVPWRARTLQRPEYLPELDLVVEAPDGSLAAFCIAWFHPAGPGGRLSGQIEPLGVAEGQRGRGLGRAILAEALRRLYRLGAEQVFVETDNSRDAALALYESAGFQVKETVLVYRKDFEK